MSAAKSGVLLEAQGINKFFDDFHVLKDISFKLGYGEFASVMGKSGCGKSTLLYILSTMDTEFEGRLFLDGRELDGLDQAELSRIRNSQIGFVFQFHYLLNEFTVLENVMLPARKQGKYSAEEIEARAYQKLKVLGIEDQATKTPTRLSGGQKQRVAIARALVNDPLIVMGDEPTGNLDSYNSDLVFGIFREICSEFNQSLLVVTHDEDFAMRTDRTIDMSDGRIISNDKFGKLG